MINRVKQKLEDHFTLLPNELFCGELSPKAIGIFAYLCSKDDSWQFYLKEIKGHFNIGLSSLRSGIKELEDEKMLLKIRHNNSKGKIYYEWILYPTEEDLLTVYGKPVHGKTVCGKSNVNNKDITNRELNNKEPTPRRENFKTFKERFIKEHTDVKFFTEGLGWVPSTAFKINSRGLIINTISNKIINKDEAYKIWDYLYIEYLEREGE